MRKMLKILPILLLSLAVAAGCAKHAPPPPGNFPAPAQPAKADPAKTSGATNASVFFLSNRLGWVAVNLERQQPPASVIPHTGDGGQNWVQLNSPGLSVVQQLAFPVRSGPALVEIAPYSLLFATRRQDSLFCLNDAVCKRVRQLHIESQQGVLTEEWFSRQRAEQAASRKSALMREALTLGSGQRVRRWPDLRLQLLLKHFGQHTLAEYDQIITDLLASGDVRCEWRKRDQEGNASAIPGNDDLLLWR